MRYRTIGVATTAHAAQPIIARCQTIRSPVEPVAYDWVKLVIVRQGSAILLSEFGERHIRVGDVLVLGTQTLCGSEPEGAITVTAIYLDRDYVIDQIFWQHMSLLTDRLDAQELAQALYSEPAQILRLGEDRVGMLMPWLDELVALSLDGGALERFFRMQSLLFAVLDVIAPYVKTTTSRNSSTQRRSPHLSTPRSPTQVGSPGTPHQPRPNDPASTTWPPHRQRSPRPSGRAGSPIRRGTSTPAAPR